MTGLVFFLLFLLVVVLYQIAKRIDRWEEDLEWEARMRDEQIRRDLDRVLLGLVEVDAEGRLFTPRGVELSPGGDWTFDETIATLADIEALG